MSTTITLPRDGQRPLRFQGEELAESRGKSYGRDPNRWYDLSVYRTQSQRYILAISYHTQWQGETSRDTAVEADSLEDLVTYLEKFDPCEWVQAYKHLLERHTASEAPYRERQDRVEEAIRNHYAAQVSDICTALDIAEEID